jgi:predicted phage terminase large subunit-like protein
MTDEEIKKIKVAKVKCMKSLLFHTRYFFMKQYNRKFVIGDHHKIICETLERVLKGELKRVIFNVAPRYGKTELVVKNFISHGLALNPSAKFVHLSYADNLALDNSMAVKDTICSSAYQEMFPNVRIKKDAKAVDKWYTTEGGGVLARAAGGQVTGFGAGQVENPDAELDEFLVDIKEGFGGAIIIDDPIKPEDADSDTVRERVNSQFDSTIRNRVNSRNTPIIVIMQRLHPRDLSGYLMREEEQDDWTVISLPCINEEGNPYGLPAGEALWPFKHTKEELEKLKLANDVVYERQYNQNPYPKEGLMFPIQDLLFFDPKTKDSELDDPEASYLPADPANLGGDDFAAIMTKLIGNRIYVTDVIYNLEGADVNSENVIRMALEHNPTEVGVEAVFGWAETCREIRKRLADEGFEGNVRGLHPRTGKHSRINSRSSFIRNHFVFRSDYRQFPEYAKFMQNLTSYLKIQAPGLKNKHDEAPDVCEMAAGWYERNYPHVDWAGINK